MKFYIQDPEKDSGPKRVPVRLGKGTVEGTVYLYVNNVVVGYFDDDDDTLSLNVSMLRNQGLEIYEY